MKPNEFDFSIRLWSRIFEIIFFDQFTSPKKKKIVMNADPQHNQLHHLRKV